MDYNKNKDFDDQTSNRTNNVYINNQEKNSDLLNHLINKPKIPMSYYFPEGNLNQHAFKKSDNNQFYNHQEECFYQSNFNETKEEIIANTIPFVIFILFIRLLYHIIERS